MFRNPFMTVRRVETSLGVTNQGARNLIRDAVRRGWLQEIGTSGRGGRAYWLAQEIWDVREAAPNYRESL
jgi:predicted HTH transcriptional regulator